MPWLCHSYGFLPLWLSVPLISRITARILPSYVFCDFGISTQTSWFHDSLFFLFLFVDLLFEYRNSNLALYMRSTNFYPSTRTFSSDYLEQTRILVDVRKIFHLKNFSNIETALFSFLDSFRKNSTMRCLFIIGKSVFLSVLDIWISFVFQGLKLKIQIILYKFKIPEKN